MTFLIPAEHSAVFVEAPRDARSQYSDFGSLGQRQSIIDIHAEISDGILDVGMAQQYMYRPQVTGRLVDQRSLGSSH